MLEVIAVLAVLISGLCAGIVFMFFRETSVVKTLLTNKVAEFDIITKQASTANTSLADKMIEFEKRLESVEFRQSAGTFGAMKK